MCVLLHRTWSKWNCNRFFDYYFNLTLLIFVAPLTLEHRELKIGREIDCVSIKSIFFKDDEGDIEFCVLLPQNFIV